MTGAAAEHTGEAADVLRYAATIADPYQRADVIWEAVLRLRCASECLDGLGADRHSEIARRLEEGCEADGDLPGADALRRYARRLSDT